MAWYLPSYSCEASIGLAYSLPRSFVKCMRPVYHRACDRACPKYEGVSLVMKHDTGTLYAEVDHKGRGATTTGDSVLRERY